MDMQIGKHFSLKELTVSQTAARLGWKNDPDEGEITSLEALVKFILDPLEDELIAKLKKSITVNSAFRSVKVNAVIGGAKNSQHTKGEAADIIVSGCTNGLIISLIEQLNLPYDQLIDEFGEWVHISYSTLKNRGEKLTARHVKGKTVYTKIAQK